MNSDASGNTGVRQRWIGPADWFIIGSTIIHFVLLLVADHIPLHRSLFTFFYFSMVLVPGFSLSRLVFRESGRLERVIYSFLCGSTQIFLVLFLLALAKAGIVLAASISPVLAIIFLIVNSLFSRDHGNRGAETENDRITVTSSIIIILTCLIVFSSILVLYSDDPLSLTSDSPDHLAYMRTVASSGETFPEVNLYSVGGILTKDLRKGLSHGLWASINLASGRTDPIPVWPLISVIGAIFMLLVVFYVAVRIFGDGSTGLLAVFITIFIFMGGLSRLNLVYTAYSFLFGKIFGLLFLAYIILYLDTGKRWMLIAAAASSFCAVSTHIGHIILHAFLMVTISSAFLIESRNGRWKEMLIQRVPLLGITIIAVNIPYVLMRIIRDYAPNNVIHEHVQGLFQLGSGMMIMNPLPTFRFTVPLTFLALVSVLLLWKKSAGLKRVRAILWSTIGIFAVVFNPLLVPFLTKYVSYMLIRLKSSIPPVFLSALLTMSVVRAAKGRKTNVTRFGALVGGAVIVIVFGAVLIRLFSGFAYSSGSINRSETCYSLSDLYEVIDSEIPDGSVIMSDPITSYCIPAFCNQYVVCTSDQHSIPNDSTALQRIFDVKCLFLPDEPLELITETLDRYGADHIVINGRIPSSMHSMYWKADESSAIMAIERLRKYPEIFTEIFSSDRLAMFRYNGISDISPQGITDIEIVESMEKLDLLPSSGMKQSGIDGIVIRDVLPHSHTASRGKMLSMTVEWIATGEIPPGSYRAYIRFDREFPKGSFYRKWYGKIYRKVIEKMRRNRYRFRTTHQPMNGLNSPDRWPEMTVMDDRFSFVVPSDIAPGEYTYSVKLLEHVQYPNYSLSDLLSDDDIYAGEIAGSLVIK
ncbi:MAG: glucosyltransferase domain-containing protein [Bacteroidales bacterium]|nr:glucosyltransferase domain-containing protein [Candidatus Latescibacterota bacterium]